MTTADISLETLSHTDRPVQVAPAERSHGRRAVGAATLGALGMGVLLVLAAQVVPQLLVVTF
jgi:hypothetical protein